METKEISNGELFNDFLNKQAIELYEWSLFLYYCWWIIHWRNIDWREWLENYNDSSREIIQEKADKAFKQDAEQMLIEGLAENPNFKPYFPNDPLKECAITFLIGSVIFDERGEIDLKNKNSFLLSSTEYRCLSILYGNFPLFQDVLGWENWFLFPNLNALCVDVLRDGSELIGYWNLKNEARRAQRKGGLVSAKKLGIILAIEKALNGLKQDHKYISRESLWRYFERHHDINKGQKPIGIENHEVFFSSGRLCQTTYSGNKAKTNSIGLHRFKKYVSAVRKNRVIY